MDSIRSLRASFASIRSFRSFKQAPRQPLQDLRVVEQLRAHDVHIRRTATVTWNYHSKDHPRHWSPAQKYYTTVIISWLELFMTALSSSGAAAADSARLHFGCSQTFGYFSFITVYLLGQAIAGVFCSPISETFGRRTLYVVSTIAFCVLSAIIGAAPHISVIIVGRFFQGAAASIPATVAFGNFEDMFNAEKRIWIVYGYTISGMVGLVSGPIYSAYIVKYLSWRWVFYIAAIIGGVSAALCVFIRESKASQLLEAKVKRLQEETGHKILHTDVNGGVRPSIAEFCHTSLLRPMKFLITEPLVMFCSILCAIAFGTVYGLTEAITIVYTTPPFNNTFSNTSASLAFLALLIGEILDVLPRIYDYRLLKSYHADKTHQQHVLPETKVTSFAIACPALAFGLWLFAWTVPPAITHVPWPVSMLGLVCIGFSINDFSYVLFGYITDSYGEDYAASSVAAVSLTRTLTAAVFPLFTTQMFTKLDNNVALTVLAGVATAFLFTPFLFLRWGEDLRGRSKTALSNEAFEMHEAEWADGDDSESVMARDSVILREPTEEEKEFQFGFTDPWTDSSIADQYAFARRNPWDNPFEYARRTRVVRELSQNPFDMVKRQFSRKSTRMSRLHPRMPSIKERQQQEDEMPILPKKRNQLTRVHQTYPLYPPKHRYKDDPAEASGSSSSESSSSGESSRSGSGTLKDETSEVAMPGMGIGRESVAIDFV